MRLWSTRLGSTYLGFGGHRVKVGYRRRRRSKKGGGCGCGCLTLLVLVAFVLVVLPAAGAA